MELEIIEMWLSLSDEEKLLVIEEILNRQENIKED